MKILFDGRPLSESTPGGVTRVARGLLEACTQLREHTFFIATTGLQRPTTPTHHLALPNKLINAGIASRFISFDTLWKSSAYDISFFPNIGFIGAQSKPYLLVVHDVSFLIEPRWFKFKGRVWHDIIRATYLIQHAQHILSVSDHTTHDLIERCAIPADRITRIPLGLSPVPASLSPLPLELIGRRFVLALDASNLRKNIACAREAVRLLRQHPHFQDVILVTLGNAHATITPNELALHHADDSLLATLMRKASAFFYPSWYEGFGLPLHEAARFHTPCLASTYGALPETAPKNTIFLPPSKPHLWAEALETVLEHPDRHKSSTTLKNWQPAAKILRQVFQDLS